MSAGPAGLVSVDGVNGTAVNAAARDAIMAVKRPARGGISRWDASGVFQELAVAGEEAGLPSARTLILLYAADLAFRIRWQIRPVLAEGRVVVAAPYVDTAIAFGRAAGLSGAWLTALFRFAPRASERHFADAPPPRAVAERKGFVEFGCDQLLNSRPAELTRQQIVDRTRGHLQRIGRHAARR